ncbi:HAD family hydrolase [Pseudaestuariivita sp.]|uniref:HAD family hydrolase n=1 Tax=Pseudaestuariivita sp. TaxID=2211669 RepID=UPI004059B994
MDLTGWALGGLIFDKDGTLLDLQGTWGGFAADLVASLAENAAEAEALSRVWQLDLAARRFEDTSPAIAGTNRELAELASAVVPRLDPDALERRIAEEGAEAQVVPLMPLVPLFDALGGAGLRLGVMTNDAEVSARAHLTALGVLDHLDVVIGSDSGHGGKPDSGPVLAAASRLNVSPARCAMVGDSVHDLEAGRAAGTRTIAVLTGTAPAEVLAPWADVVLGSVAELPAALSLEGFGAGSGA